MGRIAILMVLLAGVAAAALLTGRSSVASALVLGGVILGGYAVYRMRAARVGTEQFFGDAGEETRLTTVQGEHAAGETPDDPDRPA